MLSFILQIENWQKWKFVVKNNRQTKIEKQVHNWIENEARQETTNFQILSEI